VTSDQGIGGSSRALRHMGIQAVNVLGQVVHPECRKPEEIKLTVRFLRDVKPGAVCVRCGRSLMECPDAA
jgi:hypothetical protein